MLLLRKQLEGRGYDAPLLRKPRLNAAAVVRARQHTSARKMVTYEKTGAAI